jgi:hypothetical protein
MMALFRAMKEASRPPAASIDQRRKTYRKFSLPNEDSMLDRNVEPLSGVDTANGLARASRERSLIGEQFVPPPVGAVLGDFLVTFESHKRR